MYMYIYDLSDHKISVSIRPRDMTHQRYNISNIGDIIKEMNTRIKIIKIKYQSSVYQN